LPRKVFVAGEILTAADVNANLMDQAVMVFDDSAARTTAIPSPSEGMVTYLKDTDALEKYTTAWESVDTGGLIQVVSTAKTDTFTTTSTSFTDITGLSVSITPKSASHKVLVTVQIGHGDNNNVNVQRFQLVRGSTAIGIGDAAGSRARSSFAFVPAAGDRGHTLGMTFLDSPATTSATTYKVQMATEGGTSYINRRSSDADSASVPRTISTITVMEVAV
jgi:hypothetical protein